MKTSTIKMIAAFAAVCLLSANVALAKNNGSNGGNKGSNSGNHSGISLSFGGGGGGGGNNGHCKDGHCRNYNNNCYNNSNCNSQSQNFEPFHSSYIVVPGDTFSVVSMKEYGTNSNSSSIARFNNMPLNAPLVPGQTLMLPSIRPNGILAQSNAPAAGSYPGSYPGSFPGSPYGSPVANYASTNGISTPNTFGSLPTTFSTPTAPVVEAARPKVSVGSTLLVDGQTFGDKQGAARLRVSGLSLPVEVLEWTTSGVKIHLPTVELTSATKADIEVLRADGSLASKTAVELSAATEVALTK